MLLHIGRVGRGVGGGFMSFGFYDSARTDDFPYGLFGIWREYLGGGEGRCNVDREGRWLLKKEDIWGLPTAIGRSHELR